MPKTRVTARTRSTRTTRRPRSRVEIFRGRDGDWYFRHIAGNGRIIAASEGYTRRWNAIRGAMRAVPGATITDVPIISARGNR